MSANTTTDGNGAFTVNGIPTGTYDVEVKHAQSLSLKANGLVFVAGTSTSQAFGTLLAGDVNNDDAVTIIDFSILRASFGLAQGDAGFDPRADLNGNGGVDILDFSILRSNFGLGGPVPVAAAITPD
jgi:hypothetical protein